MTLSTGESILVAAIVGFTALWIFTLVKVALTEFDNQWIKASWIIAIAFTHLLGALAYWIYFYFRRKGTT
jgi:predicted lysophospholipase L1 biosynthesis ABC-type transport system permease subunit